MELFEIIAAWLIGTCLGLGIAMIMIKRKIEKM